MSCFRQLFTPIRIGSLELANRIVMPAIHLAYTPERLVTDRLVDFYQERAAGGVGLIIAGGCPVDEYGGGPSMIGIGRDGFVPGLTRLVDAVHREGVPIAAQLYHAGRYSLSAEIGRQALAPSALPSPLTRETPREMSREDIARTIGSFVAAARRAREAGFDAVEISGSAGYLLSQFLSPLTNQRDDKYGGSFENRMRFPLEVVQAVRGELGPEYPILVRIAGNDFVEGGNANPEAAVFAQRLEQAGVDAIDVTGGWHETPVPQITMGVPRGAFSYLARAVKAAVDIPVISSNRYNDPLLADSMLCSGAGDMIAMGRPLIADPQLPNKARQGRVADIQTCVACNQGCFDSIFLGQAVACLVNPRAGREARYRQPPPVESKQVVVVGGGPAGMQAAAAAASRGHRVTLLEREDRLGGQLNLAAVPPGREELQSLVRSLVNQLAKEGVEVQLGQEVTADLVLQASPGVVIVATGATPSAAEIPGADGHHVIRAWDVLAGRVDVGQRVVVLGGGATGCLVALDVARMGTIDAPTLKFLVQTRAESWETLERFTTTGTKHVTVLEALPKFGTDLGLTTRWTVLQELRRSKVSLVGEAPVRRITPAGVIALIGDQEQLFEADTVILATGVAAVRDLYNALLGHIDHLYLIGDAKEPRKAFDAVREGFETGTFL
ncbi:MAG TPA: FAD-dependent oxidoreductase [Anaerolineae bacterium]|nr:FAD-dependent oxidoreductase [Anaerolineae bacterium]